MSVLLFIVCLWLKPPYVAFDHLASTSLDIVKIGIYIFNGITLRAGF